MNLSEIPRERIGDLLDSGVWVSRRLERAADGLPVAVARFAAPDASPAAGAETTGEDLTSVWAVLRSIPADATLVINPGGGELVIGAQDAEALLGGSRATASALSFRARARLGARWVLVHRGPTGRFAGTLPGPDGRPVVPAWFDEPAAQQRLPEGATVVQTPLLELLEVLDEFDVAIDVGTPGQLFIDRILGAELLATKELFPRGYLSALGHLEPRANADYLEAAVRVAGEASAARLPLAGLWVVGYQLEDAPARVVFVADSTRLDAISELVAVSVEKLAAHRPEQTNTVLLSSLSPESIDYVRQSPDYVTP